MCVHHSDVPGSRRQCFAGLYGEPPNVSKPANPTSVRPDTAYVGTYTVRTFRKAGTSIPGNRPTTTIVRTGPYRFSPNPIYLAFTLFQIGLAAWVNSLGLLLALLPALAPMVLVVIPREERYVAVRFPSEYLPYMRAVRRWL